MLSVSSPSGAADFCGEAGSKSDRQPARVLRKQAIVPFNPARHQIVKTAYLAVFRLTELKLGFYSLGR